MSSVTKCVHRRHIGHPVVSTYAPGNTHMHTHIHVLIYTHTFMLMHKNREEREIHI